MNRDEYNTLFHRLQLNLVAFKPLMDCDEEVLKLVNAAITAEREACANLCEELRLFHCEDIGYSELPYKECAFNIRERGQDEMS